MFRRKATVQSNYHRRRRGNTIAYRLFEAMRKVEGVIHKLHQRRNEEKS